MIAALATLWRSRGLVMAGLAAVTLLAMVAALAWQRARVSELSAELSVLATDRDTWRAAAEANAVAVEEARRHASRDLALVAADRDAALARLATISTARKDVAHAAGTHLDGPPSPVLLSARDHLARLRGAGAAGGHGGPGGAGDPAGRAADLQR